MPDALEELNRLRARSTAVTQRQARSAADLDNITQRLKENMDRLRTEFGCESIEDARAKLASLQEQLNAELQTIASQLDN